MAKTHSQYVCQQCGYSQVGWSGKCPNCGAWGSLVETVISVEGREKSTSKRSSLKPISLSSVSSKKLPRILTNIEELDRVLGGGMVSGQVILVAGEPGIGKSTLLLQVANKLGKCLYVSGEESANQIAIRAQRLGIKNSKLEILEDTDIDSTISVNETIKPKAIIVDSIQVMSTSDLSGMAGSVGQVRECAFRLVRLAKTKNIPIFIVGHVTKEGGVAGPAVLAHIVDTVLWFEGEKNLALRVIRAVKNRFGPTDEVGIFEMKDIGLLSLPNPEKVFLTKDRKAVPGSIISATMQGTRPVLVEIQSLTIPSKLAFPKRIAQGIDPKRFELLLAVLGRRCNLPLYEYDCFINVAGGLVAKDPGIDLAICISLATSFFNKPLSSQTIAIGEVGLLGEIREVAFQEKAIKLARRLGYKKILSSKEFKFLPQVMTQISKS